MIGKEIDEQFSYKIGLALGKYLKRGKALIAQDPRPGAAAISAALIKGLRAAKIKVDELGILSTPELTWYQVNQNYDLAVSVTGSHLPWDMIGIIPTSTDGAGITSEVGQRITEIFYGL